ncbi:MAG: M48 family metallopeptidase [Clostridia bacterium]|nr:M48 family metallopeptidase [Clostridia bacterium]
MQRSVKVNGEIIDYTLIKTARASVEIRVLPNEIRLFAPQSYPLRRADQLVRDKADWIAQARRRFTEYEAREAALYPMTDGMPVPVEGRQYTLRVTYGTRSSAYQAGDELVIITPDTAPDKVREALRGYLIGRAQQRIRERLDHFIPLVGRAPGRVTIREQRTKWGSCSGQGNLNFNWKLIMAPPEALDYVVIHELCHLYEFNHSPRFWERVSRYMPEYAVWRDFLRSGWAHPFP